MTTDFKVRNLVRFFNEKDDGLVHRIVSVTSDGMIELHDHGGYFAPHLFVEATDVAGIPDTVNDGGISNNLSVIACQTDSYRERLFEKLRERYCMSCGRNDPECPCCNDE